MDKKIILVIYKKTGAEKTTNKINLTNKLSKEVKKIFLNG